MQQILGTLKAKSLGRYNLSVTNKNAGKAIKWCEFKEFDKNVFGAYFKISGIRLVITSKDGLSHIQSSVFSHKFCLALRITF